MNKLVVVAIFVSVGVTLGLVMAVFSSEPRAQQTIEWLENPRALQRFDLESQAGRFDNRSLKGRWSIVLFGFLHCPDICPTSLSQMAMLSDKLNQASIDQKVAYVFVSVDPGRDSIAELDQYVGHFDASIQGVTGKPDQLAQLTRDLGIQYAVSAKVGDYTVAHSVTYSIIDPAGNLSGRFAPGFDATTLATNLISKLKEGSLQACHHGEAPGMQTQC